MRNFLPGYFLANFFTRYFFSEITHTRPPAPHSPLKSQMVGRPLNIPGIGIQNVIEVQKKNLQPSVRRQPKLTKDFQSEKILCKPK